MLERFFNKKFDPLAATAHLSLGDAVRRRLLDVILNVGIPFNRWLGLKIKELSADRVEIESPPSVLRRNHVGTAHACAQALIGEYAAGLVVAQNFPLDKYRMIIGKLEIDYHKAGRGILSGIAEAPSEWPQLANDEAWVDMRTNIVDEKQRVISVCLTRWQIKSWSRIEADRLVHKGKTHL
jgi:acyl-coenzyme A thioesterase PaaI-like protein